MGLVVSVAGVNADLNCRVYLKDLMTDVLQGRISDLHVKVNPEPDNHWDVHALRVDINGKKIGYVGRSDQTAVRESVPHDTSIDAKIAAWGMLDDENVYCSIEIDE